MLLHNPFFQQNEVDLNFLYCYRIVRHVSNWQNCDGNQISDQLLNKNTNPSLHLMPAFNTYIDALQPSSLLYITPESN